MSKAKTQTKTGNDKDHMFDVVFGFDMETDIGSFTPHYEA